MEKDLDACVKSLAMVIAQYRSSMTHANVSHVLRHIDNLLAGLNMVEINRLFNSRNVIGSQCISEVEKLLTDRNTSSHLLSKVIEFYNCLTSVYSVCSHLQNSFSLSTVLCTHVVQFFEDDKVSHIVPHVLVLLGKLAYRRPLSPTATHINQVLELLLRELDNAESELLDHALNLLNHMISNNISIQIQIKSMLSVERIKNLMQLLKQVSTQRGILALSILTSVFWKDDIGKKLYRGQNWFKAMKIIFHTLFDDRNIEAQITAADLCIELLNHQQVSQQIAMYEEEHGCINMLFELLQANSPATSNILEVLLKFSSMRLVRRGLCKRTFAKDARCWKILLKVAASDMPDLRLPIDNYPSILALMLVREICEELIESMNPSLPDWSDLFVLLNSCLTASLNDDVANFNFSLYKALKAIQIISCVCSEDDTFLQQTKDHLKWDCLDAVLEYQMTHNLTGIVSTQPEWSSVGVHVVISTLELMMIAKHLHPSIEKSLFCVLQDVRMVPFFVSAFSSLKSLQVQSALRLYQEASSLPEFPVVLLAEKIAEVNSKNGSRDYTSSSTGFLNICIRDNNVLTNSKKGDIAWTNACDQNVLENVSVVSVPSSTSSDDKENLDVLASKLHNRAHSERKLFGKTAQILDVYEQKITSLKTKENHLQDLLDAKSLALSQADRVIARHRCQQAQLEDESKKLAHMLRDSEMKTEQLLHNIQSMEDSKCEIEKELELTVEENQNLQKIAEQYDSLQIAYSDKIHRIEVQDRNLATQKQEYDTLREMHEMFKKHNEKLKIQVNEGVQQLEQLEDEKLKLLKEAGDKQVKLNEVERLLMESEKIAKQRLDEKSEQEALSKKLEARIRKFEDESENQKLRIVSLERSNKQAEHQLKEKGAEIKKLHQGNNNLEEKITSMISEKQSLSEEIVGHKKEVERLQQKLDDQKRTLSMITELSAALQNSQG